ncbi:MAG: aldo/keto reductase, partial [Acholeplasmataceae bacterium]|nr:aldo/keto reductase [Acholeplasmataceae bacterium]
GKNCDAGNVEAFRAMTELYEAGKIRAIGVSNFSPSDIENIITHLNFVPHVNQIKFHVGHPQKETVTYCKEKGILVEAYSPLGTGKALDHPLILALAKEYKKTPAQLLIRYCLEKDTLPLPKTVSEARIIENSQVDFQIKPEDVVKLDETERNY